MRLAIAIAAALALSACGRAPSGGPERDEDVCGASAFQHLVSRPLSEPFPADGGLRIFRTGDALTMDHLPERLNVEVAPEGEQIRRIFCG